MLGVFGAWLTGQSMQMQLFHVPALSWAILAGAAGLVAAGRASGQNDPDKPADPDKPPKRDDDAKKRDDDAKRDEDTRKRDDDAKKRRAEKRLMPARVPAPIR